MIVFFVVDEKQRTYQFPQKKEGTHILWFRLVFRPGFIKGGANN